MGRLICNGLQVMYLDLFLGGVLLDQLLGHMLFTILGVGCIISGFVYLLLDRLIENRSKQIPIKQTS